MISRIPYIPWFTIFLVLACCLSGCGRSSPPPTYLEEEDRSAVVDTSLDASLQEKQEALLRLFAMIERGVPFDDMPIYESDIDCRETMEQFNGGHAAPYLQKWEWDGPPAGDDFPVVLHLDLEDEKTVEKVRRVYTVTKENGRFVIQRKA